MPSVNNIKCPQAVFLTLFVIFSLFIFVLADPSTLLTTPANTLPLTLESKQPKDYGCSLTKKCSGATHIGEEGLMFPLVVLILGLMGGFGVFEELGGIFH